MVAAELQFRFRQTEVGLLKILEFAKLGRTKMGHKNYCVVSGVLFSVVALAHLLRIVNGMSIQIDDFAVPMLASWIGLVVPAGLAFWAFRITRETSIP